MPQYSWSTCPEDVRVQVSILVKEMQSVLGDALVGAYLHGSLAAGCFNPVCSDLDILVVQTRLTTILEKHHLSKILLDLSGRPVPIEISFLNTSDLRPWRFPTLYYFHYGEAHRDRIQECLMTLQSDPMSCLPKLDEDLAAHITITLQTGITLIGLPIQQVFPPIPATDFRSAILSDLNWSRVNLDESPLYSTVLNACRVLAYIREERICSKQKAGEWAVQRLPAEHAAIVRAALKAYFHDGRLNGVSRETILTFISYISNEVFSTLIPSS